MFLNTNRDIESVDNNNNKATMKAFYTMTCGII